VGIPSTVYVRNINKLKSANKASLTISIKVLGMSLHIHCQCGHLFLTVTCRNFPISLVDRCSEYFVSIVGCHSILITALLRRGEWIIEKPDDPVDLM
jgi:hypothetical protein